MTDLQPDALVAQVQQVMLPHRTSRLEFAVLTASAIAISVAAYLHGQLFHQGYAQVDVVGPLFLLNVVGSGITVALLFLRRIFAYCVGALAISVASLVSILISHSSSFFGFAEQSYDSRATAIVVAEIAAVILLTLSLVIGWASDRPHLLSSERIEEDA
jgi:hypothetical protein